MSQPTPYDTFEKIDKLINSSRFNESFLTLKKQLRQYPNLSGLLNKLSQEESNYRYMLDYLSEGHSDPSQEVMMDKVREILKEANEQLLRESKLKDSSDLYSSTRRMFSLKGTTLRSLIDSFKATTIEGEENKYSNINHERSALINEIFNFVWTLGYGNAEEIDTISEVLEDETIPDYLKAQILSAIILGNLQHFNADTFEILLNFSENSDNILLRARSLAGLVLLSILHSKRLNGNLKLRSRLLLSAGNEELLHLINETIFNIIKTYDTKRVDSKLRNEVIPELMKIKPDILNKMRDMSADIDSFSDDENPRWQEFIENSEIGEKLQEINEMQLEGADVMVTAFSNLKGYPFFYEVSNWFLPFTRNHHEFAAIPIKEDEETLNRLNFVMCDSDLHSFLLSVKTMPFDRGNQMFQQMQSQMKEAYEAMSNSIGETEEQKLSRNIRHSLQDLYRFFKFFRKKDDFNDAFGSPFVSDQMEPLVDLMGISIDTLKVVAEFYFKNKYYKEAAGFFELIDRLEPGNFHNWEKIGYCFDKQGLYQEAIKWYKKAEFVKPDDTWLEKRLALAYKNSGEASEAVPYYEKVLAKELENYHVLMSLGQCLLTSGKPEEALKYFYHAGYLKPEKLDASRAIAWAELFSGHLDKAKSQYEKILQDDRSDASDYLNAAHCAMTAHDFKEGLKLYKKFIESTEDKDITKLVLAFRDDSDIMKKLGIKTSDLRLIIDKIRYDYL